MLALRQGAKVFASFFKKKRFLTSPQTAPTTSFFPLAMDTRGKVR